jgi:uncharacterized protein (TIGR04255 family)
MSNDWTNLKNPPIILSVFQLKFSQEESGDISQMIENDQEIRKVFSHRNDNLHANIGFDGTPAPGISVLKAKADTRINSYTYSTPDKMVRLTLENGNILLTNENQYIGWSEFLKDIIWCLKIFNSYLYGKEVSRSSLRFINKFKIENFEDPLEYFNQTISTDSENILFPIHKYSFRVNYKIPDTNIYGLINHAAEPINNDDVNYYFDIDVLDHDNFIYKQDIIIDKLHHLRDVKNKIFFDTVKQKTLELCN